MTERPARGPQIKQPFEETGFSIEEVKEWKAQLERAVSDHPVLAAGIAVGTGVLIALAIQQLAEEDEPRRSRKRRFGRLFNSELGRAIMGSLATMAAARLRETLVSDVGPADEDEEEEVEKPRRRPQKSARKQARGSAARKRGSPRPRRRPVEE